ncbi:MAG: 16S rRNA (cytosine(1402)-N(4))-methyltransferase RsmH [Oligoflexia bacterium]|nr:16S rRNA (cytosine(1402)-N(4))-methyltransferase RsmH [Oligoflexia bacterium]
MDHIPVLKEKVINNLSVKDGGVFVDCTAGRGGHLGAILEAVRNITVIGIDRDPLNAEYLRKKFSPENVKIVDTDYKNVDDVLAFFNIKKADGFVFDLGFSSVHVDNPERGFSFTREGPLDMRYDTRQELTAEAVVNDYTGHDLAKIIKNYGEESFYRAIVRNITEQRKKGRITSTLELRDIIHKSIPARVSRQLKIDPATKTFQALRIEVNGELDSLETGVEKAIDLMNPGGRICVISFHSLEDRIVKNIFKRHVDPCVCPKGLARCLCGMVPDLRFPVKNPLIADDFEVKLNNRARSAKLRVAEKIR